MKVPIKYPDFYKTYNWRTIDEENNYFVGRKIELEGFWREMYNVTHFSGKQNMAYIGHRKLGKTAFLKRCYNLAFWEQDEIMPFYFSFPQQDDKMIQLETITEEIVVEFLKQAICFITKDESVLDIAFEEEFHYYIKNKKMLKAEFLIRTLKMAKKQRENLTGIQRFAAVWKLCDIIARIWNKKTLIIIDEAQEMDISIYENNKLCPCRTSIANIIQQPRILTIVSGSLVSILAYKFLDHKITNRFRKKIFSPLKKPHAAQLTQEILGKDGYKGIEDDIFQLVGGNPFYIKTILANNDEFSECHDKSKDFSSREKLDEVYKFEMFHGKGAIFRFWQTHFQENMKALNNDPKGKKGLAVKILYKIATSSKVTLSFKELADAFKIKISQIKLKIDQLRSADLIDSPLVGEIVYKIADEVLAVILAYVYKTRLFDSEEKAQAEIDRLTKLEGSMKKVKEEIVTLKQQKLLNAKGFAAAKGIMNLCKGIKREGEVHRNIRRGIKKKLGIFQGHESDGGFYNINITTTNGSGCQIDLYTTLKQRMKNGKSKKITFIAEVKHHSNKIGKPQIEKFIATLLLAKKQHKLKNIMTMYISSSGFSKPAEKMLKHHDIYFSRSEKEFLKS